MPQTDMDGDSNFKNVADDDDDSGTTTRKKIGGGCHKRDSNNRKRKINKYRRQNETATIMKIKTSIIDILNVWNDKKGRHNEQIVKKIPQNDEPLKDKFFLFKVRTLRLLLELIAFIFIIIFFYFDKLKI